MLRFYSVIGYLGVDLVEEFTNFAHHQNLVLEQVEAEAVAEAVAEG